MAFCPNADGIFQAKIDIDTSTAGSFFVAAADLDGDHRLLLLSAKRQSCCPWYRNNGRWYFTEKFDIATTAKRASSVAVVDLNGDRDLDVLSSPVDDNRWNPKYGGIFPDKIHITTTGRWCF